jgi:hypothetical protein
MGTRVRTLLLALCAGMALSLLASAASPQMEGAPVVVVMPVPVTIHYAPVQYCTEYDTEAVRNSLAAPEVAAWLSQELHKTGQFSTVERARLDAIFAEYQTQVRVGASEADIVKIVGGLAGANMVLLAEVTVNLPCMNKGLLHTCRNGHGSVLAKGARLVDARDGKHLGFYDLEYHPRDDPASVEAMVQDAMRLLAMKVAAVEGCVLKMVPCPVEITVRGLGSQAGVAPRQVLEVFEPDTMDPDLGRMPGKHLGYLIVLGVGEAGCVCFPFGTTKPEWMDPPPRKPRPNAPPCPMAQFYGAIQPGMPIRVTDQVAALIKGGVPDDYCLPDAQPKGGTMP